MYAKSSSSREVIIFATVKGGSHQAVKSKRAEVFILFEAFLSARNEDNEERKQYEKLRT